MSTRVEYMNGVSSFSPEIVFINEKGKRLVKRYDSPVEARRMLNKMRHSSKVKVISYFGF